MTVGVWFTAHHFLFLMVTWNLPQKPFLTVFTALLKGFHTA